MPVAITVAKDNASRLRLRSCFKREGDQNCGKGGIKMFWLLVASQDLGATAPKGPIWKLSIVD